MNVKMIDLVKEGTLRPPPDDCCQKCAVKHEPELPHNQQSLFWQYWFYKQSGGRWPKWSDALAHCSEAMQLAWRVELLKRGVALEQFDVSPPLCPNCGATQMAGYLTCGEPECERTAGA